MDEGRDAPGTVATLLHLGAVGIEDAIEHGGVRPARRFQDEGLVETDAGMPVRQSSQRLAGGEGGAGRCLEDDEVVAHPVHLREVDAHGERITESEQPGSGPVSVEASIHHRKEAGTLRLPGGFEIDHPVLKPDRREFQPDTVLDDARDVLGATKDIDDIDLATGREHLMKVIQIRNRALTQHRIDGRRDGDDPVAEALQRTGHAVAGPRGVGREPDHRDDAGRLQELRNPLVWGIPEHETGSSPRYARLMTAK